MEKLTTVEEMRMNLILDFSAVNYIDTDGVKGLKQLIEDLDAKKIAVYIFNFQGNN